MRRRLNKLLDKLFWPLKRYQKKVSAAVAGGVVAGSAAFSAAAATQLVDPFNRVVPLGVSGFVMGLYYLATQSWERHREAQELHQDAVIREAVQEYTDRYSRPGTNREGSGTGSNKAIR